MTADQAIGYYERHVQAFKNKTTQEHVITALATELIKARQEIKLLTLKHNEALERAYPLKLC